MPGKPRKRKEGVAAAPETDEFVPGTESDEDFGKVLSLLSKWLKDGIVELKVDSDGDVEFVLPREMRDLFQKEMPPGLTDSQVVRIIRTEIPALVSAGFSKDSMGYLRYRLPESLHDKLGDMVGRSKRAVDVLLDSELRERILLRRTTLGYVIREIRSLSGSYEAMLGKDGKAKVPFTTLEFCFVRPHAGVAITVDPREGIATIDPKDEIKVRADLHKEDIKALVRDLTKLAETART